MTYDSASRERARMRNANQLKIGLFAANLASGRTATQVPERWSGSWADNLALARMADEAGIDFMLPLARWKGYGGNTDYQGTALETFTWASGLLASTERMTVFATVHAPLFNPVIAAKACVTADHIGNGRLGLNPERWSGSWADNLALARMADEAGIDFMLPLARWKGYGGNTDYQGTALETFTWASGLLASTERMTVFATVHAPLFNPVIAAKACVTADHIGNGRLGLNMVVGWNDDEFAMFGVQQREHELRYEYGQEWLDAVKLMWSSEEDFDFDGKYIQLKGVRTKPKPVGGVRPLIMNAGASPVGRAFAVRNCDAFFIQASRVSNEETAGNVRKAKELAGEYGRDIDVYTVGAITCRRTRGEAEDYYRYAVLDNADFSAIDGLLALKDITPQKVGAEEFERQRKLYTIGYSGKPMIGGADDIAKSLAEISSAGLSGIGLSFVNYLDELPFFCEEVLPRLERLELREPRRLRPRIAAAG